MLTIHPKSFSDPFRIWGGPSTGAAWAWAAEWTPAFITVVSGGFVIHILPVGFNSMLPVATQACEDKASLRRGSSPCQFATQEIANYTCNFLNVRF
jgi:hypothetical protein